MRRAYIVAPTCQLELAMFCMISYLYVYFGLALQFLELPAMGPHQRLSCFLIVALGMT